ncbi:MAG: hypothetical protein N4A41_05745 [Crocinitomicaceae bacterium]|jgi:hypothetical protein|nr:hypothetical protein [Crocinitomicaceae bacterium]
MEIIEEIEHAFEGAIKQAEYAKENSDVLKNVRYKQFSDCISISSELNEEKSFIENIFSFVTMTSLFQRRLLASKIFVRGGISIGKHYESRNIIFSKALINAYKIESTISTYPRIVLDNQIIETINETKNFSFFQRSGLNELLIKDWENSIFVNHFSIKLINLWSNYGAKISKPHLGIQKLVLKDAILTLRDKEKQYRDYPEIRKKYVWLLNFLRWYDESESFLSFKGYFDE